MFQNFAFYAVLPFFQNHLVGIALEQRGQAPIHDALDAGFQSLSVVRINTNLDLRVTCLANQVIYHGDGFLVGVVGPPDALQDRLLRHFLGAGLNHHDGIRGTGQDQTQLAVGNLLVGWVNDVLAVFVGDTG